MFFNILFSNKQQKFTTLNYVKINKIKQYIYKIWYFRIFKRINKA